MEDRARIIPFPNRTGWDPWVTKRQLAQIVGFSVSYIEKRAREGMPSEMRGGKRMFRLGEAQAWLERYWEEQAAGHGAGPDSPTAG